MRVLLMYHQLLNDNRTPLLSGRKAEKDVPHAMALNDNKIMFTGTIPTNLWIRLLNASHRAGNDAHDDNEILLIIEIFREAGFITN